MPSVYIAAGGLTLIIIVLLAALLGGRASLDWEPQPERSGPEDEDLVSRALAACQQRSTLVLMTPQSFHVHPLNGPSITVRRSGLSERDHEHLRSLAR